MSKLKILLIFLLFVLPLISVYEKVNMKDISFIPTSSSDEWNIEMAFKHKKLFEGNDDESISIPLISTWHNQKVVSQSFSPKDGFKISGNKNESEIVISRESEIKKLTIHTKLKLKESQFEESIKTAQEKSFSKLDRNKYLSLEGISEESLKQLRELNNKFIFKGDSAHEKVRKIYFFITEEIITSNEVSELEDVVSLAEGTEYAKARLMTVLARINRIPARTSLTFRIKKKKRGYSLKRSYLPEVLISKFWYPISVNALTFSRVPKNQFILAKDMDSVKNIFKDENFTIKIAPIMVNKVDSEEYLKKVGNVSKFWAEISLHNLPVSMQSVFYTVLLIPIGTLLLSFGRNIVGLRAFGTFTPILLSLFFLETSIITGLIFFCFIVLLGFVQRYALDRFYLLAVPKLSILLTLVILSYSYLALLAHNEHSIFHGGSLNYFPIIIVAVFIERFSVHFIEEGPVNTLKALGGTIFISFLCYMVFQIEFLKLAMFNHPELLFMVIGGNLLIGSYKGYRLTEFIRFKELRRVEK